MQFTVEVTQGKHKHRGGLIAGKADDHASPRCAFV